VKSLERWKVAWCGVDGNLQKTRKRGKSMIENLPITPLRGHERLQPQSVGAALGDTRSQYSGRRNRFALGRHEKLRDCGGRAAKKPDHR
jgi:hypothetical protein